MGNQNTSTWACQSFIAIGRGPLTQCMCLVLCARIVGGGDAGYNHNIFPLPHPQTATFFPLSYSSFSVLPQPFFSKQNCVRGEHSTRAFISQALLRFCQQHCKLKKNFGSARSLKNNFKKISPKCCKQGWNSYVYVCSGEL